MNLRGTASIAVECLAHCHLFACCLLILNAHSVFWNANPLFFFFPVHGVNKKCRPNGDHKYDPKGACTGPQWMTCCLEYARDPAPRPDGTGCIAQKDCTSCLESCDVMACHENCEQESWVSPGYDEQKLQAQNNLQLFSCTKCTKYYKVPELDGSPQSSAPSMWAVWILCLAISLASLWAR